MFQNTPRGIFVIVIWCDSHIDPNLKFSLSLSLFFSHVAFSLGDGISYPIQMMDEDAATLLGNNYVDATDSGTENLEF